MGKMNDSELETKAESLKNNTFKNDTAFTATGNTEHCNYLPGELFLPFHGAVATFITICLIPVSCIANILICIVIVNNKNMHSTINYYLVSLAISDIMMLVTHAIVLSINLNIQSSLTNLLMVEVIMAFSSFHYCVTVASNLISLTITIDRYIAVCHPFTGQKLFTLTRTIKIIAGIWVFSLAQGALFFKCLTSPEFGPFQLCVLHSPVYFIVPMTINLVLYTLISIKIFHSWRLRKGFSISNKSSKSNLHLSVSVLVEFLMCWGPINMTMFLQKFRIIEQTSLSWANFMTILYLLSTVIDPIIYSVVSKKFRNEFLVVFRSVKSCCLKQFRGNI